MVAQMHESSSSNHKLNDQTAHLCKSPNIGLKLSKRTHMN